MSNTAGVRGQEARVVNISWRTARILTVAALLGLGSLAGVSGLVLDQVFAGLEETEARDDMGQVRLAVEGDLDRLSWSALLARDRVGVLTQDPAGLSEAQAAQVDGLADELSAHDVDVLVVRAQGNWSGWGILPSDPALGARSAFLAPPLGLTKSVQASSLADATPLEPRTTLLQIGKDAYLAGARAVSSDDGKAMVLVALRLVDEEYAATLGADTGLRVQLQASGFDRPYTLHRDGLSGWTALDSLDGDEAPVLQIQVDGDRSLYRQGMAAYLAIFAAAFLVTAILLVGVHYALRNTITGRLQTLARRVADVRASGNLGAGVALDGSDELAGLSRDFDRTLTDLEARSTELTRSNEELGAFASVVGHDLKSPLATFTLNLAVMARRAEAADDDKQRERVARMERTVVTMQDRIEAVLEYSRAGREPNRKVVALDDVGHKVLEDVEAHLLETQAHVELRPLPSIKGDRQALSQVFQNLIQNSLKYRRPDVPPRVRVHAEPAEQGGWYVLVADNGRGFEEEEADRMMQPFQRLEGGLDQSGHGIGLATVARIMEAHDGTLAAYGKPGRGAIMRLWFPAHLILAAPSPGRASLVGGLRHALPTQIPAPPARAPSPVQFGIEYGPEPEEEQAKEVESEPEPDQTSGPEPDAAQAPRPEPEKATEEAPDPPPKPLPHSGVQRPRRPSRPPLTARERAELEAHLQDHAGPSQRSSPPPRARNHGPDDGAQSRPSDRPR